MNIKKAIVVGGCNGIGLAISVELLKRGYQVIVMGRHEPTEEILKNSDMVSFIKCDLSDFDEEIFYNLAKDPNIDVLMITAGIGRVAKFEFLHIGEIEKLLTINTVSTIKIIRIFYDRICSKNRFHTGVIVSIAGLVSSPMFSVYAASKAADARFIESINIELEMEEISNKILNISPGSIRGTKFNGGENDLTLTSDLSQEIVNKLLNSDELFIPKYEETFKNVIKRYQEDPHEYGIHSYHYKDNSGRVENENKAVIGYLSGTFDLFHIGHLNLLKRAKEQCDYLIVGVHDSGAWKGKETFIPLEERKAIVDSCKYVDKVIDSCREDSDVWNIWHYNKLFVGSDYKGTERFNRYEEYFIDKDVEIVYFPYTQNTSSTKLRKLINDKIKMQ